MTYSIGEVAEATGIAISTLRYYDREGLFPNMGRSTGGIRVFSEIELETLRIIECLKMTDMPIKDIKQFLDWCQQGDDTLEQRRDMFHERLDIMNRKMDELRQTIETIQYKCWYYETAVAAASEDAAREMPLEDMPEEIQDYARKLMAYKAL